MAVSLAKFPKIQSVAGGDRLPVVHDDKPVHARTLIELRDVNKRFNTRSGETVIALDGVNLGVADGEFLSVVGPSGCGKTTLLRILAGLEPLTSGFAMIEHDPVAGPRDDVAVVFQQATLLPWYSVLENVLLPVRLRGTPSKQSLERAEELLELAGLSGFSRKAGFDLPRVDP
jgi:NitT/TauT family transport system ATP-binding protein